MLWLYHDYDSGAREGLAMTLPIDDIISPYTNPAEIEAVGMLINDQSRLYEANFLVREDFTEERHWKALQAIRTLHASGKEISVLTVAEAIGDDMAEYSYLGMIARERGFYRSELLHTRLLSIRREAINRACKQCAITENWARIVELRQEYGRLMDQRPTTLTAAELLAKQFQPLEWLIDGVLPEGTTLLAAPPKVGKSRLALQLAIALANGGYALNSPETRCKSIEVLYLALESGERRLQKDIQQMYDACPVGLHVATTWPRLADGGEAELEAFLEREPGVKLVIIDTLAQARSATHGENGFLYSADYLTGKSIKDLADRRGISILVVHHTRKATGEDPLDSVSGSYGVTGSVDHVLILQRKRMESDGMLSIISRDYPDNRWALTFNQGLWTLRGTPEHAVVEGWTGDAIGEGQREIMSLLRKQPMKPTDIANDLGKSASTVRTLLQRMTEKNRVYRRFDGTYAVLPDEPQKMN